jgi:hypothetical protein
MIFGEKNEGVRYEKARAKSNTEVVYLGIEAQRIINSQEKYFFRDIKKLLAQKMQIQDRFYENNPFNKTSLSRTHNNELRHIQDNHSLIRGKLQKGLPSQKQQSQQTLSIYDDKHFYSQNYFKMISREDI